MKSPLIISLLAGSMMVSAAAQAQETSPFSGPRIEILGGYDQLSSGSDVDIDTDNDGIFEENDIDQSVDGFAYGAAIGYDFDLGSVIVGLEGEYMDSTGKQGTDEDIAAPFGYRINVNRDLYVGARIGAQVAPSTLLYAKGGYTNTRVESRFQDRLEDDGFDLNFDDAQSVDGFRVGAGVEQLIGPGYVKLEYRYSNYSAMKFDDRLFSDNQEIGIDLDRHQVVAGVGMRF
ncbi:porin family protein [Parasphingorhabdus sp.]|uniref:outer membrane protein n=1 Tax=Parasphingorhabdus sp. TaxID=2709688 RepID=UPI002F94122F